MIQVDDEFRKELDSGMRKGISVEANVDFWQELPFSSYAGIKNGADSTCSERYPTTKINDAFYTPAGEDIFTDYSTFEKNAFDLNNPKPLYKAEDMLDKGYYHNEGYVSNSLYFSNNSYQNNIFISRPFLLDKAFVTSEDIYVTCTFGNKNDPYPTEIDLKVYEGAKQTFTQTKFPNSNKVVFHIINDHKANITQFDIDVKKMSRPGSRLRISSFVVGNSVNFSKEIVSANVSRNSNILSSELPKNEVTLQLYDRNRDFDIENPENKYGDLKDGSVRLYYKFKGKKYLVGTYALNGKAKFKDGIATIQGTSEIFKKIVDNENKYDVSQLTKISEILSTTLDNDLMRFKLKSIINKSELTIDLFPIEGDRMPFTTLKSEQCKDAFTKAGNIISNTYTENKFGEVSFSCYTNGRDKNKKRVDNISGRIEINSDSEVPWGVSATLYDMETGEIIYSIHSGGYPVVKIDNNYYVGKQDYVDGNFLTNIVGLRQATIPYLADPTIEVGDIVIYIDNYNKIQEGFVVGANYSFPPSPGSDNLVVYTKGQK